MKYCRDNLSTRLWMQYLTYNSQNSWLIAFYLVCNAVFSDSIQRLTGNKCLDFRRDIIELASKEKLNIERETQLCMRYLICVWDKIVEQAAE
jgi:hypothetical protein